MADLTHRGEFIHFYSNTWQFFPFLAGLFQRTCSRFDIAGLFALESPGMLKNACQSASLRELLIREPSRQNFGSRSEFQSLDSDEFATELAGSKTHSDPTVAPQRRRTKNFRCSCIIESQF